MIKILLSKKLGELRLTQADLARATGIRPNTINELYHELTERVSLFLYQDPFLFSLYPVNPYIPACTICLFCFPLQEHHR